MGLYWGPLILGNYHVGSKTEGMGVLGKVARNQPPERSRSSRFPESCLSIQMDGVQGIRAFGGSTNPEALLGNHRSVYMYVDSCSRVARAVPKHVL